MQRFNDLSDLTKVKKSFAALVVNFIDFQMIRADVMSKSFDKLINISLLILTFVGLKTIPAFHVAGVAKMNIYC